MAIWIYSNSTKIPGDDQDAGREAARLVFEDHKVSDLDCHAANLREADGADETGDARAMTIMLSAIWIEAEHAAISAATKGWARVPDDLSLGLA